MEFRPSSVRPQTTFVSSSLQKGEKEALSAFIVTFLAANGDDWNHEFAWQDFGNWLVSDKTPVNDFYKSMTKLFGQNIINAMHELIADGYIVRRDADDTTYFKISEKYIEFFRPYAV